MVIGIYAVTRHRTAIKKTAVDNTVPVNLKRKSALKRAEFPLTRYCVAANVPRPTLEYGDCAVMR